MSCFLDITVNDANFFAKGASSSLGGLGMFSKYSVYIYIDGNEMGKFTASKEPYRFQLAPGDHVVQVTRNKIGGFNMQRSVMKATNAAVGFMSEVAVGTDLFGGILNSVVPESDAEHAQGKGMLVLTIADGQTVSVIIGHSAITGSPFPEIA